jgi:hypothetical protein
MEGVVFNMKSVEGLNMISLDIQTMELEIKLCSYLRLYMHDYHSTLINTILTNIIYMILGDY